MVGRRETLSEDANMILDYGVNVAGIARLFNMDAKGVSRKLLGAKVFRTTDGVKYYKLRDVGPLLVDLPEDVVSRVMRLNHMDLPPMLKKEYWQGQAQMLKVKEAEGDLWQTDAVIGYVAEAFKDIRMEIMLVSDAVERETELSDRQRDRVKAALDGLLESIRVKISEKFGAKRGDPEGRSAAAGDGEPTISDQVADL